METFFYIPQENEAQASTFQKLAYLVSSEELPESSADDEGILADFRENYND